MPNINSYIPPRGGWGVGLSFLIEELLIFRNERPNGTSESELFFWSPLSYRTTTLGIILKKSIPFKKNLAALDENVGLICNINC